MSENNNNDVVDQNPVPEKMKKTQFPEGLRVLVVDDDITCLKTLAVMLQKCQYQGLIHTHTRIIYFFDGYLTDQVLGLLIENTFAD